MGGRNHDTMPGFPSVRISGITLTKTRIEDAGAWAFFEDHCAAEGMTISEAGSGAIAAAMTAYAASHRQSALAEAAGICRQEARKYDWKAGAESLFGAKLDTIAQAIDRLAAGGEAG